MLSKTSMKHTKLHYYRQQNYTQEFYGKRIFSEIILEFPQKCADFCFTWLNIAIPGCPANLETGNST